LRFAYGGIVGGLLQLPRRGVYNDPRRGPRGTPLPPPTISEGSGLRVATLSAAREKWERKTATAGQKWKERTRGKGAAWCSGVARFLGVGTCNPEAQRSFEQGVEAVSASDFQSAIEGKGAAWEDGMRRALAG